MGSGDALSALTMAIEDLNISKEMSTIIPASSIFSTVGIILTMIKPALRVANPGNLISLHSFLSSTEMIIFLDNAESILNLQGPDAQGIYNVVEESI